MIIYNKAKQKNHWNWVYEFKALPVIKETKGKLCDSSWHLSKGQIGHEINHSDFEVLRFPFSL